MPSGISGCPRILALLPQVAVERGLLPLKGPARQRGLLVSVRWTELTRWVQILGQSAWEDAVRSQLFCTVCNDGRRRTHLCDSGTRGVSSRPQELICSASASVRLSALFSSAEVSGRPLDALPVPTLVLLTTPKNSWFPLNNWAGPLPTFLLSRSARNVWLPSYTCVGEAGVEVDEGADAAGALVGVAKDQRVS